VENQLNRVPMGDIDDRIIKLFSEEDLLLNDVVQGDNELLFLDTFLTDINKYKEDVDA
jgi:hypothetical protein